MTQLMWRPMSEADLSGVEEVADVVHPNLPEDAAVVAERLQLYPQGCWVLSDAAERVKGYVISHPVLAGRPPELNERLGGLPTEANVYYIHDLALLPEARGGGRAADIVEKLLSGTHGFLRVSLISVYGSSGFWERFGFEAKRGVIDEKLRSYGEDAVLMSRRAA